MPLKAFFVDIAEEKFRFCSYLCSNVVLVPTLSVVRRQIPVNFSQFFYLLSVFFSACMFFLLIGIEAITGDRLCFSYQL